MLAIDRALETIRQPKLLTDRKTPLPLPQEMLDVIKCAAGDENTLQKLAAPRNIAAQEVKDAARVYLQHIVTHADGNDYQTLGLTVDAPPEIVREHRRWMAKWLHPDLNPSQWETALFYRVQAASERLGNGNAQAVVAKAKAPAPVPRERATRLHSSSSSRLPGRRGSKRRIGVLRMLIVPVCVAIAFVTCVYFAWLRFGLGGVQ